MSKHMTIINLACTITKLRKWGEAWKHSAESAQAATARMHQANKDLERAKVITDGLVDKLIADRDAAWTERDTQAADHSRQLTEHRAAFGARTEADAKIIAGLREDLEGVRNSLGIQAAKEANKVLGMIVGEGLRGAAERVVRERDGLLTQVQDMRAEKQRLSAQLDWERAEIKRLQWENVTMHKDAEDGYAAAIKVLGDPVALSKERDALRAEVAALQERLRSSIARGDFAQMEVAALKSQNPKQHPVKVGEWVRRISLPSRQSPVGIVKQVTSIRGDGDSYGFADEDYWGFRYCEPCDPPATHDTEAGKAAAESAVRTEPVAEEIKVGDVVEVVSNTGRNTWLTDVGSVGTVTSIETLEDSLSVRLKAVPDKKNVCGGYVSICDVRKVTT